MKCPYCQNENEVEVKQTEFFTGWIVKCFGCGLTSPQMKEKHEAVSLWYQIRFVSEDSQMNVEAPREYKIEPFQLTSFEIDKPPSRSPNFIDLVWSSSSSVGIVWK